MDRPKVFVAALALLMTGCEATSEEPPPGATSESAYATCPWTRARVGEGAHAISPIALRASTNGELVAAYRARWNLGAPEMRTAKLSGGVWTESSLSELHGMAGPSLGFAAHPNGRSLIVHAGLVDMLPKDVPVRLWSDVGTASMTTSTLTTTQDVAPLVAGAVTADGHEHVLVADSGRVRHFARASSASPFVLEDALTTGLVFALDARAYGDDLHVAYANAASIRHARLHQGTWADEPVAPGLTSTLALAVDASGRPHVAYQEKTSPAKVVLAAKGASGWSSTLMATVPSAVGTQPLALALEASGTAVVAYEDAAAFPSSRRSGGLRLAVLRAGVVSSELVSRDHENGAKSVGLAVDPQGRTHVLYQPGSGNDLLHLVRAPSTNGACP